MLKHTWLPSSNTTNSVGPPSCASQALALGHWNHFVAGAVYDEQRTFYPLRRTREGEATRDLPRFIQRAGMAPDAESLLRGRGHCRQYGTEIERPAVRHAGLDARLEGSSQRRIERAQALTDHGDVAAVHVGARFQKIDHGSDPLSPLRGDRALECGLSLSGSVERQGRNSTTQKGLAPCMQLLLARVEPGQNDRDGRTRHMRRPPQIACQLRAAKRN